MFDGHTAPAWIMVVVDLILIIAQVVVIKEPAQDEELRQTVAGTRDVPPESVSLIGMIKDPTLHGVLKDCLVTLLTLFLPLLAFWVFFSELLPLAIVTYGMKVTEAAQVYAPVGIGAFVGSRLVKKVSKQVDDLTMYLGGITCMAASCLFFFNYTGAPHPKVIFLYIGAGCISAFFQLFTTALLSLYSKIVDTTSCVAALLALHALFSASARFTGPTLGSKLMKGHKMYLLREALFTFNTTEDISEAYFEPWSVNVMFGFVAGCMVLAMCVSILVVRPIVNRIPQPGTEPDDKTHLVPGSRNPSIGQP
eukprot:NODE_240_length_1063_cov_235.269149_g237_i0.p1 GENE.NODE_240_length_1063_cov_235.269149_g237_i0~~NODE_240_length_1063_cov_235.269149_g237_i0.p1  ORF type:complete len:319 (+),score=34.45 NODE_240_length_1063_cov_235.269149_g237_i0:35-958(+)